MKILNIIFMAVIALSHTAILCYLAADIVEGIKRRRKKKGGKPSTPNEFWWEDGEFDTEPFIPELSRDAILKLKPERISEFVHQEMFAAAPRTIAHMTLGEQFMAELLLTSYIGLLLDTAPDEEHDFTVLLELLESSTVPEDEERISFAEMVIEDCKLQSKETKFYEKYRQFKTLCTDMPFIVLCCTEIVRIIVVKLYGYIPDAVHSKANFDTAGGYDEYDT